MDKLERLMETLIQQDKDSQTTQLDLNPPRASQGSLDPAALRPNGGLDTTRRPPFYPGNQSVPTVISPNAGDLPVTTPFRIYTNTSPQTGSSVVTSGPGPQQRLDKFQAGHFSVSRKGKLN